MGIWSPGPGPTNGDDVFTGDAFTFMDGASATASGLGNVSQDFAVSAIGDYNGDGKDDILWWNDNGSLGAWMMNGAAATGLGLGEVTHDWVLNPGG